MRLSGLRLQPIFLRALATVGCGADQCRRVCAGCCFPAWDFHISCPRALGLYGDVAICVVYKCSHDLWSDSKGCFFSCRGLGHCFCLGPICPACGIRLAQCAWSGCAHRSGLPDGVGCTDLSVAVTYGRVSADCSAVGHHDWPRASGGVVGWPLAVPACAGWLQQGDLCTICTHCTIRTFLLGEGCCNAKCSACWICEERPTCWY